MPTYTFKVIEPWEYNEQKLEVDSLVEIDIKISNYDQFKLDNPQLERYHDRPPSFTFFGKPTVVPYEFTEKLQKISQSHGAPKMLEGSNFHHNRGW